MIRRLCSHPSCTRFRLDGSAFCEKHQADQIERDRRKQEHFARARANYENNKASYYRSFRWHRESADYIKDHPYCQICGSTDHLQVHHHWPKGYDYNNDTDFWDRSRWIVVCAHCHQQLTHTNTLNIVAEQLLH